jgi:hypothetical protein
MAFSDLVFMLIALQEWTPLDGCEEGGSQPSDSITQNTLQPPEPKGPKSVQTNQVGPFGTFPEAQRPVCPPPETPPHCSGGVSGGRSVRTPWVPSLV